ncbi:Choline kinase alpha [Halotydeus destructor]|nr:Choline kinase alpha [Halotydeus destructor]
MERIGSTSTSPNKIFDHGDDLSKEKARNLCANFLAGSWDTLTDDTFDIQVVPAGLNNRIFICENKATCDRCPEEPTKVILRLYGGKALNRESSFKDGGNLEEVLVFYTMSSLGLGPKLFGVFPEGRVEQYISSRMYNNADYDCPETEALFARKLARMHVSKVPLNKQGKTMFEKIEDNMATFLAESKLNLVSKMPTERLKQLMMDFDEEAEYSWLKEIFPRIKTRQVLSHGDLNRANVLIANEYDKPDDRLVLIDYEGSSYDFRGANISSHFMLKTIDLKAYQSSFSSGQEYPSTEERERFIQAYNDEIRRSGAYDLDESENGLDNVDQMLMECTFFDLLFAIYSRFFIAKDVDKYIAVGVDIFSQAEANQKRYWQLKAELTESLNSKV